MGEQVHSEAGCWPEQGAWQAAVVPLACDRTWFSVNLCFGFTLGRRILGRFPEFASKGREGQIFPGGHVRCSVAAPTNP